MTIMTVGRMLKMPFLSIQVRVPTMIMMVSVTTPIPMMTTTGGLISMRTCVAKAALLMLAKSLMTSTGTMYVTL